jgi:hypothetical protein
MTPARSFPWFLRLGLAAAAVQDGPAWGQASIAAPAAAPIAAPVPAQLQATPIDNPTLSGAPSVLPSPALTQALLPPECGASESVLRLVQIKGGALRQERLPGRVQALAWLDDRRILFVRTLGPSALLEVFDTQGRAGESPIQSLAPLPAAAEAPWARRVHALSCDGGVHLHVERAADGAGGRLALAIRRSDTRFEIHRAQLSLSSDTVSLGARVVDVAGLESTPPRYRLWQVIPSLRTGRVVAVWLNQPGLTPAKQVDLIEPSLGPIHTGPNLRTIAQVNEDLAGCAFVGADIARGAGTGTTEERLLCHTRSGDERGWLWTADMGQLGGLRLRQFTYNGGAAAYALSPGGDALAYVGTGGAEGPVTVQELKDQGAQAQAALQAGCSGAAFQPQIFWGPGGHLLTRGACGPAWYLLAPAAPIEAPRPAPQATTSRAQKSVRRAAFWSPRY